MVTAFAADTKDRDLPRSVRPINTNRSAKQIFAVQRGRFLARLLIPEFDKTTDKEMRTRSPNNRRGTTTLPPTYTPLKSPESL